MSPAFSIDHQPAQLFTYGNQRCKLTCQGSWTVAHKLEKLCSHKNQWKNEMMATLTPSIIALVATSVVCQVIGASLMPLTKGLTEIIPTLGFAIAFAIGLSIMARLINSGINLSALLPFMAAVVPLCAIAVGVLAYDESASALKISLLVFSCLTIGFASSMS